MHGPKKAKIANKQFNEWLKKKKLFVLGKEFEHSVMRLDESMKNFIDETPNDLR